MMKHFEFIIEDSSGKIALTTIAAKLLPQDATYNIHSYRGIGRIPTNLTPASDPSKRILLDQLPRLIRGYGKAFSDDPPDYLRVLVIICDLDKRNLEQFDLELTELINSCDPRPKTLLCLSVEEGEAWLLGDVDAVIAAYPKINKTELMKYVPDSICGTWEFLADLVENGGSRGLKILGYQEIGRAKHEWARKIAPNIEIARNRSPSFQSFVSKISQV